MTVRHFAIAKIRTSGPSNRVRGEFLVEFTGRTVGEARVWNAKRRRWTERLVDVMETTQVADWRSADQGDLKKFGCAYEGPIGC